MVAMKRSIKTEGRGPCGGHGPLMRVREEPNEACGDESTITAAAAAAVEATATGRSLHEKILAIDIFIVFALLISLVL